MKKKITFLSHVVFPLNYRDLTTSPGIPIYLFLVSQGPRKDWCEERPPGSGAIDFKPVFCLAARVFLSNNYHTAY